MIAYHYLCINSSPYVKFIVPSIHFLIHEGKVDPKQIFVSMNDATINSPYTALIRKLGVTSIWWMPNQLGFKICGTEKIFMENPDVSHVVQIDSDIYLHGLSESLDDRLSPYLDEKMTWSLYEQETLHMWKARCRGHSLNNFNVYHEDPRDPGFARACKFYRLVFGVDMGEFLEWIKNRGSQWAWGDFVLINRKTVQTQFWRIIHIHDFLSIDDESAFNLGMFKTGLKPCIWKDEFGHQQVWTDYLSAVAEGKTGVLHLPGHSKKRSEPFVNDFIMREFAMKDYGSVYDSL